MDSPLNSWSLELFEKNRILLEQHDTLTAQRLQIKPLDLSLFCYTQVNELNLCVKQFGIVDYYHDPQGAVSEAHAIADPERLKKNQVIYFYGLGLGYIYLALKEWLAASNKHHLVFMEDDLEVWQHFLATSLATDILQDKQVTLVPLDLSIEDTYKLYRIHSRFIDASIQSWTLPYYVRRREKDAFFISYRILYDHSLMTTLLPEYLSGQSGYLRNFYSNLLQLPHQYAGNGLFGTFKNVPAIICGAGPSLEKHASQLSQLKERALIFAGGSALNVLNAYHVLPHFGLGIDPNEEQFHRLLTNGTFHTPFFYRARLNHDAMQLINGPKLYVPGSLNKLADWYEEKLGITGPPLDEGHNVINFCTEIARLMGCNPLIYIGMDLAFSEKTYAKGIATHPTWIGRSNPYERPQLQQIVFLRGMDGKKLETKWDWVQEANWIAHYAEKHPELTLINATEGGLGFRLVPNLSFKDACEKYLHRSYDLQSWIHGEIQLHHFHLAPHQLIKWTTEFKKSLEACANDCNQAETQPIYQSLLETEIAYTHFLDLFDKVFAYVADTQNADYIHRRLKFLESVIDQHLLYLTQALKQFIWSPPLTVSLSFIPQAPVIKEHPPFDLTQLKPIDVNYADGTLKMRSYYKNDVLHGPSRFFAPSGQLLAETWFIDGQKEDTSHLFYPSGNLYGSLHYHHNQLEGEQKYYYENGALYVTMNYLSGQLNGDVFVYNVNGQLKRELHYVKGERHHVERLWDEQGHLILECFYDHGRPIGTAYEFWPSGMIKRETVIHEYPEDYDMQSFNEQQQLQQKILHGVEDYSFLYKNMQNQIDFLDNLLTHLMAKVQPLIEQALETHTTEEREMIEKDLQIVRAEMQRIHAMRSELMEMIENHLAKAEDARQHLKDKLP